jgi:tetratricopeptide (TPR) repeat protein
LIIISSFILALLSKIQAVFLPLSMLLVDYYFDRRLNMKLVYEKWLYFLLSLITGIVGTNFLKVHGTLEVLNAVPVFKRILFGSYSYIVYIIKSVVPFEMVPLYPFPETISWAFYLCIAAVLSILGLTYYFFCNKKKAFVFGLLFFTFNIILLLQIRAIGAAFLADRYTYIAYFGLFFIYAYGLQFVLEKYGQFEKLIYLSALLILVVLGYVNYEQNKIWKNGETLWSHTLKYYNQVPFAWEKRANYYSNKGQLKEALLDYNKAIQYSPETRKGSNLLRTSI